MPNRVKPSATVSSALLAARDNLTCHVRVLKTAGWCCIPVCCAGVACFSLADVENAQLSLINRAIAFYGGVPNVKELATKVNREQSLFRAAVTKINNSIDPANIKGDVKLIDIIYHAHPRIKKLLNMGNALVIFDYMDGTKYETYYEAIWTEYEQMGGNYHVVIYGILEYICTVYDATCTIAEGYFDRVVSDSAARVECLSHKALS